MVITSCTRNAVVHYGRVGSNPTLSVKRFSLQAVLLFVDFFWKMIWDLFVKMVGFLKKMFCYYLKDMKVIVWERLKREKME